MNHLNRLSDQATQLICDHQIAALLVFLAAILIGGAIGDAIIAATALLLALATLRLVRSNVYGRIGKGIAATAVAALIGCAVSVIVGATVLANVFSGIVFACIFLGLIGLFRLRTIH